MKPNGEVEVGIGPDAVLVMLSKDGVRVVSAIVRFEDESIDRAYCLDRVSAVLDELASHPRKLRGYFAKAVAQAADFSLPR